MSLFNEYQNKNFTFLTRYINGALSESKEMTEEEFAELLISNKELTYPDIAEELSNSKENPNENALIFRADGEGVLKPILDIPVPVRATKAERSWLYYYLDKPEARLFLEEETIQTLKHALEADDYNAAYPLNSQTYDVKEFYAKKEFRISLGTKEIFRIILKAIHEKRYIITDNVTAGEETYHGSKLIPFRFEYIKKNGSLHISALSINPDETQNRAIKLNLMKLSNTKLGEKISDYEKYHQKYLDSLNKDYDKQPTLIIKISNENEGFDRTAYVFANYKRESYRDSDNNIIMRIFYRRFQERSVLEKLLFLGKAITVQGPDEIREKYVSLLKETLQNYSS